MLFFIKGIFSLTESDNPRLKRTKKNSALQQQCTILKYTVSYFATASRRLRIEKMNNAETRHTAISTPHTM